MSLEQDMVDVVGQQLERLDVDEQIYVAPITRNFPGVIEQLEKVYKLQKLYNDEYTLVEWIGLESIR